MHDEQRALTRFGGQRKEGDRDRRLLVMQVSESVDFGQRRLRAMDRVRHIFRGVENPALRIAEAQRLEPLVLHQLFEKWLQIGARGLRREAGHNALMDGPEHEARPQLNIALRPFVDDDRSHLGHCGDEHHDGRQSQKGSSVRRGTATAPISRL